MLTWGMTVHVHVDQCAGKELSASLPSVAKKQLLMKGSVLVRSHDRIWQLPGLDAVSAHLLLTVSLLVWWDHPADISLCHTCTRHLTFQT